MTIYSMTGFALARRESATGSIIFEMRSVNSRFLDTQFRISDELRAGETTLREAISGRLSRGKLDCRFYIHRASQAGAKLALNVPLVQQLGQLDADVRSQLGAAQPLTVSEVLHWPGVLKDSEMGNDEVVEIARALGKEALDEMVASRAREGEKLGAMLLERVSAMEAILTRLEPRIPQIVQAYQQKLVERLSTALGIVLEQGAAEGQPAPVRREEVLDRIRQEVTLFGVRIDVAEELSRLAAHLGETRRILATGGSCGKRLDFMMQELNREANTIGSKSAVAELADAAMELKLLIEQMREQVQNLE